MTRLTELLDLPPHTTERTLCKLVTDKTVYARIDRPAGIVTFKQQKTHYQTLNEWSGDVSKILSLVEKTSHLVSKVSNSVAVDGGCSSRVGVCHAGGCHRQEDHDDGACGGGDFDRLDARGFEAENRLRSDRGAGTTKRDHIHVCMTSRCRSIKTCLQPVCRFVTPMPSRKTTCVVQFTVDTSDAQGDTVLCSVQPFRPLAAFLKRFLSPAHDAPRVHFLSL